MATLDAATLPARWSDTSEFQGSVYTDAYGHRWASFRCMDGSSYVDQKFAANLAWCLAAYKAGRIEGYYVYFVYRPVGAQTLFNAWTAQLGATIPPGAVLMKDVESWGGAISGDCSADLNTLYGMLAGYARNFARVVGYGNQNDLTNLWRTRDSRCRVLVASYGDTWVYQNVPGAFGQQYADGEARYGYPTGWPIASDPFGNCDHNGTPNYTAVQLAALHGVQRGSTTSEDDDMSFRLMKDAPDQTGAVYAYNNAGMLWHVPGPDWLAVVWSLPGCENPGAVDVFSQAQFDATKGMLDTINGGISGDIPNILSLATGIQQKVSGLGAATIDPIQLNKAVLDAVNASLSGFGMSGTVTLQKAGTPA
jgi:hypothetical protein